MLPALVFFALATFAGALFWSPGAGRIGWLHLMLATGAMPLIFGAMSHFIPVLTRSREAGPGVIILPLAALAAGILAVAAFTLPGMAWSWLAGAPLAMTAAAALLGWSRRRRAAMPGAAHPCLAWYEAALACLIAALLAIIAGGLWPQHFLPLRRLHLHLNTLGFIGLTAIGTLSVLLPTVAGKPDTVAAQRLRQDLPWAFGGTVLVACGAAWLSPLAWLGLAAWLIPLARMAEAWLRLYRREIFALHGAAPLLALAAAGFALSLLAGAANPGTAMLNPAALFAVGFLLPLVSGAASQLLPVWLRPGRQSNWHDTLRRRLGHFNGLRAPLFLVAGLGAGFRQDWGLLLGAATMIWFLLQAGFALTRTPSFQPGKHP